LPSERSESPALVVASAKTVPVESEWEGTIPAEAEPAPTSRAAAARTLQRIDELKAVCRDLLSCGVAITQVSADPDLASRDRAGDPGASTEIAPSRGTRGLLIGVSLTAVLPPSCAPNLRDRSSTRPDWPERLRFSDDRDLRSVSYRLDTPAPPAVARRWRRLVSGSEEPSLLIRSPESPVDVRSARNPAVTLPPRLDPYRPCQTRDSWYHRNAERADWFRIATSFASGDAPRKPRRTSPAPATSRKTSLRAFDTGVDSRCIERVATLFAEQHVTARRRRPNPARSRFLRAETRSHRSPAVFGGLDVNADTNRRVCTRRLHTAAHPHDIETGDVATTAPARASRNALGVRSAVPHTRRGEPGFPRIRHTTAPFRVSPPASRG